MEAFVPVIFLLLGLFIGYAFARKQQDKPIVTMPQILQPKVEPESPFEDELVRCQHSEEEWKEITEGRRKA